MEIFKNVNENQGKIIENGNVPLRKDTLAQHKM